MASNITPGDIFIENNYNNIFIINPNKTYQKSNVIGEDELLVGDRDLKQEELVMYANLECNIQPRSRLLLGDDGQTENVLIATSKVNFLKPNDNDFFTTNWTLNSTNKSSEKIINSELLGITNISYSINASFTPTVNITLEDVRGRALFESGDDSPYSVFFNLPYPPFYLTIKGYYGKALRMPLFLQKFNGSFVQNTGNFQVNLTFVGYKFTVLQDLTIGDLYALPKMYFKKTSSNNTQTNQPAGSGTLGQNVQTQELITYKGTEYINKVYEDYKNLKLIDSDFPNLTVPELQYRIENYVSTVLEQFGNEGMGKLNDADVFADNLSQYRKQVVTSPTESFLNLYMNKTAFWIKVETDKNGRKKNIKVYQPNGSPTPFEINQKLEQICNINFVKITSNPTLGDGGTYRVSQVPQKRDVEGYLITETDIDILETYKERNKKDNPTDTELQALRSELSFYFNYYNTRLSQDNQNGQGPYPPFYIFDGIGRFIDKINNCDKVFAQKREEIEKVTTENLSKLLEGKNGLGFKPTVKNMVCVFLASSEAFLRLMDDVHRRAFDKRNDDVKRSVVNNQSLPQQVQDIQKNENDPPVFPWPQYVVAKQVDNQVKYEVQYPGDPKYIDETGANDYSIWPEVEFVEEFLTGILQTDLPSPNATAQSGDINRLLISAFDTPLTNLSYSNLQTINYLYEIYERIMSVVQYQGFDLSKTDNIGLLQSIVDFESYNINTTVSLSSELASIFKNYRIPNISTYITLLYEKSNNGTSDKFQKLVRGIVNTPYLSGETQSTLSFLTEDLPTVEVNVSQDTQKGISDFFEKKQSDNIYDSNIVSQLPPFVYSDDVNPWLQENMGGNMTTKQDLSNYFKVSTSLNLNTYNKKITNYKGSTTFDKSGDKLYNRPIVNFDILSQNITYPFTQTLKDFYKNRTNYCLTEGRLRYSTSYNGNIDRNQTTSILNTPYFINAILEGVQNERTSNTQSCYKSAAYLFLNSLPLSTLRENYKSILVNTSSPGRSELDYISATMTRYGSVQTLPKLWVYKIGSLWHRYKEQLDNNLDILNNCWTDIDVDQLYDPLNNSNSRIYTLSAQGETVDIQLSSTVSTANGTVYQQCLGFYPKLINDFSYFFRGVDVYDSPQTIQLDLQSKINSGELILKYDTQSINITTNTYNYHFSLLIQDGVDATQYYTIPSVGTTIYQDNVECYNVDPTKNISTFQNQSVYNGSARLVWGLPNFGYFDTGLITKPTVRQHLKKILISADTQTYALGQTNQDPFALRGNDTNTPKLYDTIEELFGVFTHDELNKFEEQFLEFSKPSVSSSVKNSFQVILRDIIKSNYSVSGLDNNGVIENVQNDSVRNLREKLKGYIGEDTIIKISNPTKYDIQTNNYFFSEDTAIVSPYESTLPVIQNYNTQTPNSLPNSANTITLASSENSYPTEWYTLKKYVGFSTISGLTYTDSGSYYTDFFIDNNIAFTVDNIITFQTLIKSYATYRLVKKSSFPSFKDFITTRINDIGTGSESMFIGIIQQLNGTIGNSSRKSTNSSLIGEGTPVETYDRFKAINDKWIAGNDYSKSTIFQDVLFLDRANRDIGNKIFVNTDPIKNWIKNGAKASVETVVKSIIQTNNFVIFNIPSYINFYGIPTPTGVDTPKINPDTNFANSLFGTFAEVDYLDSRNKLVCFYSQPPSQNPAIPQSKTAYNDDTWNFNGQTPLNEDTQNKTDYALSNRVVGFSVDYGTQNQQVFNGLQVSQDLGKATSESLAAEFDLRNAASGVKSSTQNVSLFNIYKTRSYQASVECLGNAMIQPSMYFVLRNVPMFEGPYWITSVSHTIAGNNFKTNFSGTRQRIVEYPTNESYLQSVRQKFLSNVKKTGTKQTTSKSQQDNVIKIQNNMANNLTNKKVASPNNSCSASDFLTFYADTPSATTLTFIETFNNLTATTTNQISRYSIFCLTYIESEVSGNNFKAFDYNFGGIPMTTPPVAGNLSTNYLNPKYICMSLNNVSAPYASFKNVESYFRLMTTKFEPLITRIVTDITKSEFVNQFAQYYIEYYPVNKVNGTPTVFNDFKTNNPSAYSTLTSTIKKAYDTCVTLKL